MITLISPAKSIEIDEPVEGIEPTIPSFIKETMQLVRILKKKSVVEFQELMHISENLAKLNRDRYKTFKKEFTEENSRTALHTFKGDVYRGLNAEDLDKEDLLYAQSHLRILSGLYGILKPLDRLQPYRLEMGTRLENKMGTNLYAFWGNKISNALNKELKSLDQDVIINLASNEYFKAVNPKKVKGHIYEVNFKEFRDGNLKFISFNAKRARGLMAHYIIKNRIEDPLDLKGFDYEDYHFHEEGSSAFSYLFVR